MSGEPIDRRALLALAACCIVPMVGIVVLTGVVGWSTGAAGAVLVGLVAGGVCVAAMVQHHRKGGH